MIFISYYLSNIGGRALKKQTHIYYGGDYNPEQWSEDVWKEDMRLMKKAGVNLVSVGIFSWALLQPNQNSYDFAWLDRLLNLLAENGIGADLATATASPPAWMAVHFPDSLPVDQQGMRMSHGSRQHYCPNSKVFREFAVKLVTQLAERYRNHPALQMWHINNEYACHVPACYCDQCAVAFRVWLEKRYGTIDELNRRWGTNFWSQKYYSWEEIVPPSRTPTYPNPGQTLDYSRFMSDSLLECYLAEYRILKEATPDLPVLTNFMGDFKPLDYFKWAEHSDIVTWDSYPEPKGGPVYAARNHDLMRSLRHGQPFILMEQVTSQVNWRQQNPMKRPGVMRLWSYQTVAHGGDGVMFFQWRQSQAGAEKFHAGMVPYTGDENSRVFREVEQLGNELKKLDALVGSRYPAEIAILFDYENWWALELPSKPSMDVKYIAQVEQYYKPLFERNLAVNFVKPSDDLSSYKLVIAPALYMLHPGVADNLEQYVSNGGTLVTSFFSGIVDENDRLNPGGYGGPLRKLLGVAVEEVDPMHPGELNGIRVNASGSSLAGEYSCSLWADMLRLEGAQPLASFTGDYYAGQAAVTEHRFGQGRAVYVGTQAEERFTGALLAQLAADAGVRAPIDAPQGVEAVYREKDGRRFLFLLNHNAKSVQVSLPTGKLCDLLTQGEFSGTIELEPYGVAILE
jgi:beta-galactosidase